ncbi:MAG: YoaK family protein [Oscillospiraceae bacterium]|nr:YoaK family protein [Oscillospiraceae bacterium]
MNKRTDAVRYQASESFVVGALLTIVGGYLDAYTYLCRGGVFANAQTGNIAALGFCIVDGNWYDVFHRVTMILAFVAGIILCNAVEHKLKHAAQIHWRQIVVLLEAILLGAVALIPHGGHDLIVNDAISLVCAMQVECFRKMRGIVVASTMCTGSLRSGTRQLFVFLRERNVEALRTCLKYYIMIALFVAGVAIGAALTNLWMEWSSLVCCGVLLTVFCLLFVKKDGVIL